MKNVLIGIVVAAFALALPGCSSSDQSGSTATGPAKVAPPAILQAGTLKVCAPNDGAPPSVYYDDSGELVGSEVDLAKGFACEMGLKKTSSRPRSPR